MIRVVLPVHLRTLARTGAEVSVDVEGAATLGTIIDAVEAAFPVLCGTIRDRSTRRRRPFVRYFACGEDLSHAAPETPLPRAVLDGTEPFLIVGAMAGG